MHSSRTIIHTCIRLCRTALAATNKVSVAIVLMIFFLSGTAYSQLKKSTPGDTDRQSLQGEIARLRAELAACQGTMKVAANSPRDEAIASLRAVRSALSTGSKPARVQKYLIESRIKVDALPDVSENRTIREISDLYKDAMSFGVTRIKGTISAAELEAARRRYSDDEKLKEALTKMASDEAYLSGIQKQFNQIHANFVSQILIIRADTKFSELK